MINKNDDNILSELKKSYNEIIIYGKGKCCVCRHDLDIHTDEKNIWRCSALGADGWQCECSLRKDISADIKYYDLSNRAKKQVEELDKNKRIKKIMKAKNS